MHPVIEVLLVFATAAVVLLLFRAAAAMAERDQADEEESWEVRDDDGSPDLRRIDDRD